MERAGLVNKVKIKLDEFTPDGVDLPFDDYIGPMLDESAKDILEQAPLHLIIPEEIPTSAIKYQNDLVYIPVPDNYIRLYEIKFPSWKKSIREAISQSHPMYEIQENEYTKSGLGRPSVVLKYEKVDNIPGRWLVCGKVSDVGSPTPSIALYVRELLPEQLSDHFADALTWLAASKIFQIEGLISQAEMALAQYKLSLQNKSI